MPWTHALPWLACPTHRPHGFLCTPPHSPPHGTLMSPVNITDAVHSDAVDTHSQVAKRRKMADAIRPLRTAASTANIISSGNRSILPDTTMTTVSNRNNSASFRFIAPLQMKRDLIFTPGPRLARKLARLEDTAV